MGSIVQFDKTRRRCRKIEPHISDVAKEEAAGAVAAVIRAHFSRIGEPDLVDIFALAGYQLGVMPPGETPA